jgi:SAM-dependent methyltransferase
VLPDLLARVPVVCLRCRAPRPSGDLRDGDETAWSLHTVELGAVARAVGDDILDGTLRCQNDACRAEYPILDGVAIIHPDPAALFERDPCAFDDIELDPATLALVARDVPDTAPLSRQLEHLSIYLDAHFGDRAEPPARGVGPPGNPELLAKVKALVSLAPVERAIELGASVGRWSHELSAGAGVTVALDQSLAALRRARRLLRGDPLAFARRVVGRNYQAARIAGAAAPGPVLFVCGDALDPPFPPASFDRVATLNVLDAVVDPRQLLAVASTLCRSGGELILSSPYAWQTGHVAEDRRIGGADPVAATTALLREAGLTIVHESELPWTLRRDDRASVAYRVHFVVARRT